MDPRQCVLVAVLLAATALAQTKTQRPHVLGLAHVAFRVGNMERTELFYHSLLGYEEPLSLNDSGIGKAATAFVKVNDLQYVELFQGDAQNSGQLDHFAFYTDNLTAMRAYLEGLGMYIFNETHRGRLGNPFFTIRDPDGHFVEIVEYSPSSLTSRSRGKSMPAGRISDHIMHVGIRVHSVESALRFYRDALGFREFQRAGGKVGQPDSITLRVPDGSDYIELIPSSRNAAPADSKLQNHFCLATSDLSNAVATLQTRGLGSASMPSMTVQTGGGLPASVNLFDPDGARVEIMESTRESQLSTEAPTHNTHNQ